MTTPDPADQAALAAAIALAGRLAELGETRITLHQPGRAPRPLFARTTDLPAIILAAMTSPGATLSAETLGIRIVLDASGPRPADARSAQALNLPK